MSTAEQQLSLTDVPDLGTARPPLRTMSALWLLRRATAVNSLRGKVATAQWQVWMALFTSFVFWMGLYKTFQGGFRLLQSNNLISSFLIELLFGVYFSTLLVMLVFSTGIILYAGLFDSDEAKMLLVRPVPTDLAFAYKFQESLFFSSWGFVLLGSPMLIGYGVTVDAPPSFYLLSAIFLGAYCLLPASVGALICLGVTLFVPRRKNEFVFAAVVSVLAFGAFVAYRAWRAAADSESWLLLLLQQMQLSNLPFLPSHWISKGLLAAAYPGGLFRSLFFLGVLLGNALFVYLIAAYAYSEWYRFAYDRVHSSNFFRRRSEASRLPLVIDRLFVFLPGPVRTLIIKDLRTFLRDPVQSLQLLIFTGLIALYIVLLSRVSHYAQHPYWRNMIGLLNVTVMALFLTVFTSRFIFPMLSLEGQRLWVLGLAPISRDAIMWGKFAFSAAGAILLTSGLTLLGAFVLNFDWPLATMQFFLVPILCCGVSGIAVGLGARFANRKEKDPSKIASGIPGTLNLVISLMFIVMAIAIVAWPYHLYSMTLTAEPDVADALRHVQNIRPQAEQGLSWERFRIWLPVSLGLCVALGLAATYVPMRIGIHAFRRMEV